MLMLNRTWVKNREIKERKYCVGFQKENQAVAACRLDATENRANEIGENQHSQGRIQVKGKRDIPKKKKGPNSKKDDLYKIAHLINVKWTRNENLPFSYHLISINPYFPLKLY